MTVTPVQIDAATEMTSPKTIVIHSSENGWSAKMTDPLPHGIYQIQLRRPATSRKWTDVLPWEKQTVPDSPFETTSWPLVVLPSVPDPSDPASSVPHASVPHASDPSRSNLDKSVDMDKTVGDVGGDSVANQSSRRGWIANWDMHQGLGSYSLPIESESSSSGLSSILPNSTSATKMLNRLPISWRREEATTVESPAHVWAEHVAVIRARLQRIASLNADGISLPSSIAQDGTEPNLIQRIVEAEAKANGLEVWHWDAPADSDLAATKAQPPASELSESDNSRVLSLRSNDQIQRVADLRRAPTTSLKARFAPRMSATSGADLIWLGTTSLSVQEWSARDSSPKSASTTDADEDLPAPLAESIDRLPVKAWLEDWTYWVTHRMGSQSNQAVGMVIDESLLKQQSVPDVALIEEAIAVWQIAWETDTRWLTASKAAANELASTATLTQRSRSSVSDSSESNRVSSNALVHIRQIHRNGSTMLVFLNEAPWAVRVTLPLANLVDWKAVIGDEFIRDGDSTTNVNNSGIDWSSFSMNRPSVSMLGSTVTVPADGIVACQTDQELSPSLTYGYRIEGGSVAVEQLTQDVTKIVEHLGLLGELASMSSSNANGFARNDAREGEQTNARTWIRSVTDRQSPKISPNDVAMDNESDSGSWGAAIWSSDRWGFSRAVSKTPAETNSSKTTKRPTSFASTPIARSPKTQATASSTNPTVAATHEMATDRLATDRLGPRSPGSESHMGPASTQPTSRFETYRNLILNGGFELPHEIGISGWMHSQHPVNAVEVDSRTYFSGTHCVRLLGKDERGSTAWLISREIRTPASGRIGVSLALRGDRPVASITDSTHPATASIGDITSNANSLETIPEDTEPLDLIVRIAIEGERDGQPIRHTTQLSVPADGQWQSGRIDLQCLDLDPQRDTNLRLTIDNLSMSTVWIDDIVVTDYFASQAERSELQSLAYLAVNGLQSTDLAPTARLLRNFWAQELLRVAQQSPVSLLPSSDSLSARIRSAPEPAEGLGTLNGAMRSVGLPAPAWDVATQGVPSISLERKTSPGPNRSKDAANGTSDSAASKSPTTHSSVSKPASAGAAPNEPKQERPVSLSRRIRAWIPAPLRF